MEWKLQSALEFIMAYSWALLILGLFVVVVFVLAGSKPPSAYVQSQCNIQPLLPCSETLLTYSNPVTRSLQYYLIFTNQLGSVLYFPPNAINITASTASGGNSNVYNYGNCNPSFASQGSSIICIANIPNVKANIGWTINVNFGLTYQICTGGKLSSCGSDTYRSSGYSLQSISPGSVIINTVSFLTTNGGTIVLNGVTYFNGISTYLQTGNYVLYGQPGFGYQFQGWSMNSPNSIIVAPSVQNTTLILTSNAVITGSFG